MDKVAVLAYRSSAEPEEEEGSDFFGPIDLGMWSSPGWQFIREVNEEADAEKTAREADQDK